MPCNSDHLEPNQYEIEASKIWMLLDELDGKGPPDPKEYARGMDRRAYNKADKEMMDSLTERLCSRCRTLGEGNIKRLSLEFQMWWRDHQAVDIAAGRQ